MAEDEVQKPEDILKDILNGLQSGDTVNCLDAIAKLKSFNYSSEAIRNELEKLTLNNNNEGIRREALATLDTPSQRNVRKHFNRVDLNYRRILLQEITEWEDLGFLETPKANLLRRRYDFDLTAAALPKTKPVSEQISTPVVQPKPVGSRLTLLQILLSESNIKISLYLGAFFVVASAAILGAFVDVFRIPLLVLGTIVFGGLSIAIRKRLPQPSFALFIVFSFFLPITADVIENTLKLSQPFIAVYWVIVSLFMALVWGGGTWLYNSRLFSITAFVSFVVAVYRIGNIFDAKPEFFTAATGIAVLAGLAGVWILKKWRDSKFATPLFLAAQLLQAIVLGSSLIIFISQLMETSATPLWNLASIFTWGSAFLFYIFSNLLFPFVLFPWLAAGTLFAIPWLIDAAFELEALGGAIVFFIWGFILAASSEVIHWIEKIRKYSLPILLISIVTTGTALIYGFADNETTTFICALGVTVVYAALHMIRPSGWLWALALLNFIVAYFSFFRLPFLEKANIIFGYELLGLSLLFLLPDIFLKNDFKANLPWRLPPRIYGVIFILLASISFIAETSPQHPAIGFAVFTLFFLLYTIRQRKAIYGYIPAAFLALTVFFTLDHFELDAWLPALTGLAVLYFIIGVAVRSQDSWAWMLRSSALVLGTIISVSALFALKETGGWYALVIGLLFAAEMYLSHDGWFEIGVPVIFSIGTFLILRDFNFERVTYHVLAYSFVWILTDLLAHLTFPNPRPLKWIVRVIGGLFAMASYIFLITERDSSFAAMGFGIFTLLFLAVSLLYRQPTLFYAFTLTLPLFVTFVFRSFDLTKWIHPVIFIAMGYYALGFFLRLIKRATGWDSTLLFSGLGIGVIVSIAAPILGGLDAAIPVAFAATLWAVEALWQKNVWLGFPANGLYLLAYFIILIELKVDQPQFFSMGAALLGMIQHYLLTHAENKTGAFIMGMLSQLTLLGTTYIQMISNGSEGLIYFVVLFLQSIAVLVYGIVIRSRSLTFTPIFFSVIGVLSVIYIVVYDLLDAFTTILMVGCTGILLLGLGILAVLMRERITKLGERLSEWKA